MAVQIFTDSIVQVGEDNKLLTQQVINTTSKEFIISTQVQSYKLNHYEWENNQAFIGEDVTDNEQLELFAKTWLGKFLTLAEILFESRDKAEKYFQNLQNKVYLMSDPKKSNPIVKC